MSSEFVRRYVPGQIYTIGVYLDVFKSLGPRATTKVAADTRERAMAMARTLLGPSIVGHMRVLQVEPNPAHIEYQKEVTAHYDAVDKQKADHARSNIRNHQG